MTESKKPTSEAAASTLLTTSTVFTVYITIRNCIRDVGKFKLPPEIDLPNTKIYYYDGKPNEFLFKRVASFIKKNYENYETICLGGKGHCEDVLLHPSERMKELDRVLVVPKNRF